MNPNLKVAYDTGAQQALQEAGITKVSKFPIVTSLAGAGAAALDEDAGIRDIVAGTAGAGLGAVGGAAATAPLLKKLMMSGAFDGGSIRGGLGRMGLVGLAGTGLGSLLGYKALRGLTKEETLADKLRERAEGARESIESIGEPSTGTSALRGLATALAGGLGATAGFAGLHKLRGLRDIPVAQFAALAGGGGLAGYGAYKGTKALTESDTERLRERFLD